MMGTTSTAQRRVCLLALKLLLLAILLAGASAELASSSVAVIASAESTPAATYQQDGTTVFGSNSGIMTSGFRNRRLLQQPVPPNGFTGIVLANKNLTVPRGIVTLPQTAGQSTPLGLTWFSNLATGALCPYPTATATGPLSCVTLTNSRMRPGQIAMSQRGDAIFVADMAEDSFHVKKIFYDHAARNGGDLFGKFKADTYVTIALSPEVRRPSALAWNSDQSALYVGALQSNYIYKVPPAAVSTAEPAASALTIQAGGQAVASTASGKAVLAMARVGSDLYLSEDGKGVSVIPNIDSCAGSCKATLLSKSLVSVRAVGGLASDPANNLYIGEMLGAGSKVWRYTPGSGPAIIYSSDTDDGITNGNSVPSVRLQYLNIVGLRWEGALLIGDDENPLTVSDVKPKQQNLGRLHVIILPPFIP